MQKRVTNNLKLWSECLDFKAWKSHGRGRLFFSTLKHLNSHVEMFNFCNSCDRLSTVSGNKLTEPQTGIWEAGWLLFQSDPRSKRLSNLSYQGFLMSSHEGDFKGQEKWNADLNSNYSEVDSRLAYTYIGKHSAWAIYHSKTWKYNLELNFRAVKKM